MFRTGDKVVCIDDINEIYNQGKMDILKYEIYTIDTYDYGFLTLFEKKSYYNTNRFMLLSDMRFKKIKQLEQCLK